MLLAQLTDTHIKADRRIAYGRVDTSAFLEAALVHVMAFRPKVDAVIITGDLTDSGRPEEYAAFREILSRLSLPCFLIPGNHDDRANLRSAFPDRAYLADCDEFICYAVEDFPIRLIGIDTTVPGEKHGFLCDDRLAWLNRSLAERPDAPAFLFQHHPPFETGIRHMDVQNLLNPADEFAVLVNHPQARHLACGHVHRAAETTIGGMGVSIAPNAAHSVTLDLDPTSDPSFTMDPPAIRLFRIDGGNVCSHLSYVGAFDGPHPFFAKDGGLLD